jgi:hypothetical protein
MGWVSPARFNPYGNSIVHMSFRDIGKSPVEVAIALDQPGDRVRTFYREYWELTGSFR